jgi:Holliday junction resolvase-like predicted endonuclease
VLARRARLGGVEVDVVALEGDAVVLVEVKASAVEGSAPSRRVDARKAARLRAAWRALARTPAFSARPRRLDVVEVEVRGARATCRILRGHARL